ncbi:MAG: hypothetical protein AAGK05_11900, partial [Pseudomonadota bacterium]
MEEDFNIHLVSNVSADVFPNNSPSEFSTLLANEIQLNDGGWEVAIRDIMYPSNLVEEESDDKITSYESKANRPELRFPHVIDKEKFVEPICIDVSKKLYKDFPSLYPTKPKAPVKKAGEKKSNAKQKIAGEKKSDTKQKKDGKKKAGEKKSDVEQSKQLNKEIVGPKLANKLNSYISGWEQTFNFEYRKSSNKFIIHVYQEDVLVTLTSNLAKVLGFRSQVYFFKGSTWAYYSWDPKLHKLKKGDSKFYLMDIFSMHYETFEMKHEFDRDLCL